MPSTALTQWRTVRLAVLDELVDAHRRIGGTGPGRRYTTQQINQAYVVLLCGQFQAFCRALHDECVGLFVDGITPTSRRDILDTWMREGRKLDRGNPNSGNIGSDFGRFGVKFWADVRGLDTRNEDRQDRLEQLNLWRNAVAHQDFTQSASGGSTVRLEQVRDWRSACEQLAGAFDEVMRRHFHFVFGSSPW